MVRVPKTLLVIALISMIFQTLMFGEDLTATTQLQQGIESPDCVTDINPFTECENSVIDFLIQLLDLVIAFPISLIELATFEAVPGIPAWIRVPATLLMLAGLVPPVIVLITSVARAMPLT